MRNMKIMAAAVALVAGASAALAAAGPSLVSNAALSAGGALASGNQGAYIRSALASAQQADPTDATPDVTNPDIPDAKQWTSSTWSGWIDIANQNVALRFVTANFTVPTVTCGANDQVASFWVGLDGLSNSTLPVPNNKTVEQVGVNAVCDIPTSNGGYKPSYTSFWQMYPDISVTGGTVKPGDVIAVSVYYDSTSELYTLALSDSNSTAPDIKTTIGCPIRSTCHNATAEVIAEDPNGGPNKGTFLADFGTVDFSGVAVTSRNGTKGTLFGNSLWSANEVTMVVGNITMAKPSGRTNGNTAFTDTWKDVG